MVFNIEENDSELVKHLKSEANQSITLQEGGEITKKNIEIATNTLIHLAKYSQDDYKIMRTVLYRMNDFLQCGIFSPLTLKEGEFIYIRPGLAQNRRCPYIYKDTTSIFYELAYTPIITEYYDAFKNINYRISYTDLPEATPFFKGDLPRYYIIKGNIITNIYFDRAYLSNYCLNNGWFPRSPVKLDVLRIYYLGKYIDCVHYNNARTKALINFYKLRVAEDNDEGLVNFGVKFNIKKDALFSKGTTF